MNPLLPTVLLVLITIVWGWSFVLVKEAIAAYGVLSFLAVRFMIAALAMSPFAARRVTRSSLAIGVPIGPVRWPTADVWPALLIAGGIGTAVGASIQNFAQQRLSAVRVTVIAALTPVFAVVFGYLLADDRLTAPQVAGAVLMVGAVMLAEVLGNGKKGHQRRE